MFHLAAPFDDKHRTTNMAALFRKKTTNNSKDDAEERHAPEDPQLAIELGPIAC